MLNELMLGPMKLGRLSRFLKGRMHLMRHCLRLLKENDAYDQAASLSYYTIFGLVPLVIVGLMIFQLSPTYNYIGQKVKGFIYQEIHLTSIKYQTAGTEEKSVTEYLDKILNSFYNQLEQGKGSITMISLIVVIWTAVALLLSIEQAFNRIWDVTKPRSLLHRIVNYWTVLTLGPLLLGAGIYVLSRQYGQVEEIGTVFMSHGGSTVLSYLIAMVAFFLLYFLLPNTKVKTGAALWGAALAAVVWSIAKWGFGIYVTEFIPYSQLYGILGLIPLAVLWIFVSWLIILFGLQLAFAIQYSDMLDAAEIKGALRREEHFIADDWTAINILKVIVEAFDEDKGAVAAEVICARLNMPPEFTEKVLDALVSKGLVAKTSEPGVGYLPAREPSHIRLSEVSEAISAVSFGQEALRQSQSLSSLAQQQRDALAAHNLGEVIHR